MPLIRPLVRARLNHVRVGQLQAIQGRALWTNNIPKLFLKSFRVPVAAGTLLITVLGYLDYKVQEARNYAKDFANGAWATASGLYHSLAIPQVTAPAWIQELLQSASPSNSEQSNSRESSDKESSSSFNTDPKEPERPNILTTLAAATGATLFTDDDTPGQARDDQIMVLTRKMIEIRNILQRVGKSDSLQLPSIVVIGSQSSGKSSVLEAIVGHEFLPKGNNMVTRRPIELTLVHTPGATVEYGEFPALGLGRITDFGQIQRTLTDLNMAVSDAQCVSDDPIQLIIYSPMVPDLSLIDLPGYIQVESVGQPPELREKISKLCDKYIRSPNIILAVCAADVDLANSPALRASRIVDPLGLRTIGVVTKMDLVSPERGAAILRDNQYPLHLGYIGVVAQAPSLSQGLRQRLTGGNISGIIAQNEKSFFDGRREFDTGSGVKTGTVELRRTLMHVLESSMSSSLESISNAITQELEEVSYKFKVLYNDRELTAESYLAENVDALKQRFKEFSARFGKPQVAAMLKTDLDQRVLNILAEHYWDDKTLASLSNASPDDKHWQHHFDASSLALTRLGVGRVATDLVVNALSSKMQRLADETDFRHNHFASNHIQSAVQNILRSRYHSTADQVENCVKPFKYEVEVDDREWNVGKERAVVLLKEEAARVEAAITELKKSVGSKRLGQVMSFLKEQGAKEVQANEQDMGGYSGALLQKGNYANYLQTRADVLKMRIMALKSKQCRSKENQMYCPEAFLNVVADKLAATAVLFINVELLTEFYYQFPRELENRLVRNLTPDQIQAFAREDKEVKAHIEMQEKKELLQLALDKIESVILLEKTSKMQQEQRR
ncbi:hypothetical protein SAICODRAFT_53568 [Saitoella complicata NRRL Y-17804]|nr:uncharacterized protein SAICODRAFT_53568 [Saitoella complicata NRRL Y-17804]ODQ55117.1 hypothetical protein SAICODRAFT_53568 [Saitoella complicata NRRL Y-17804]